MYALQNNTEKIQHIVLCFIIYKSYFRWAGGGYRIRTCYSPDRPADNSGFCYSPDDASMYLQRTRPGAVSLIAINIQRVILLPHRNLCFALGSHLDRLPDERSVVPASRGYRPLINPTRAEENNFYI